MARIILCGGLVLAASLLAGPLAGAAEPPPLSVEWEQLIPRSEGEPSTPTDPTPRGVVQHGQVTPPAEETAATAPLVTEYDGKRVRIPGFVVPLDLEAGAVKQFLLVPYVGACVHVPPPPANQVILVDSVRPFTAKGLFEPVWVTGTMAAGTLSTDLADVGYKIAADSVVPYEDP